MPTVKEQPKKIELSKSKYCKGVQCPKILWMDMNKPEEAEDNLDENIIRQTESFLRAGHETIA